MAPASIVVGTAAAVAQAIGLSRWVWLVPLLGARRLLPRALRWTGLACAAAIAAGALVPWGVPGADLANFVGYVAWSLWLLLVAGRILWLRRRSA